MPHIPSNDPAWRLRKFRAELKLTQQALADLLGVTRVTLSGWERGRALPSLAKAVLLEQRAGIPPSAWHRQGRAAP
jgi:transcriptional regulator with XRE-family HTH domain